MVESGRNTPANARSAAHWRQEPGQARLLTFARPAQNGVQGCRQLQLQEVSEMRLSIARNHGHPRYVCMYSIVVLSRRPYL
jgi:hypothetical protein